jgi:Fe-S cluster assembly scaffold protein SufB
LFDKDSEQEFLIRKDTNLSVSNIFNLSGKEVVSKTSVYHLAQNSKSIMRSRAVLRKARLKVSGLIDISKDASGSDGYQKTEAILFDSGSKAVSIPELSIKNNDVRCSHGAAISSLDKDKMFYMQSRGLSEDSSARLMIEGFFADILKKLPEEISGMVMERIR